MELAAFLLALAAGLCLLVRRESGPGRPLAAGCALLAVTGASLRGPSPAAELGTAIPAPRRDDGYVGSGACRACHPFEFETWHDSYHRSMTQPATPAAVLGDFGGQELETRGRRTRLWREGDGFWVDVVDPLWDLRNLTVPLAELPADPPRVRARVVMTTGSHHLQTYWIRRPADPAAVGEGLPPDDGALHQLPWVWHVEEQRWIPTQDSFLTPPQRRVAAGTPWNTSCSPCHSVGTEPHLRNETFATRSADLGIACEACHGPGRAHVDANRDPLRRYLRHFDAGAGDATIVNPARLDAARSTAVCGQCHSFHRELDLRESAVTGISFRPGEPIAAHKRVFELDTDPDDPLLQEQLRHEPDMLEGRFWRDGTIRVAGREYNGLLESPCHTEGAMTCLSCHALHGYVDRADQLREGGDDRACAECHAEIAADVRGHSRHEPGTAGASCVNCHMPFTTWGLFTAMRSHRIDAPDAEVSLRTGRPNACNQCHVDQTLAWTAEHLSAWTGRPAPADLPREHREIAASIVWAMRGDAAQRALAAWTMGWSDARQASGSGWQAVYLALLLSDPYAAVRKAAYDALRPLPGFGPDFAYDFVPPDDRQQQAANAAMKRWAAVRRTALDRRGRRVLIGEAGDPDQRTIMELYGRRDDTPVRIIE